MRSRMQNLQNSQNQNMNNNGAPASRRKTDSGWKLLAVAFIIILIIILIINKPDILVFLSEDDQSEILELKQKYFSNFYIPMGHKITPGLIFSLALVVAEGFVAHGILSILSNKIRLKDRYAETIKSLIFNLASYVVVILCIIAALSMVGVNMMAVIAGLGVMSLIVGFGAETLIEDVITGLFFVFEGHFHVGDIITVDDFRGTVISIGIRTTQIMDLGGNIRIMNNSDIRSLTNLSEKSSAAISIISISYNASLEEAEDVINDELEELPVKYPQYFKKPPVYTGVEELSSSSVDLRIVAYVDEADVYNARRMMNRELKLALDRAGIEIPFPQVVVHRAEE